MCEAPLRHAQGPKRYIVSASQGLISLWTARPCGARQEVPPPAAQSCRAPCPMEGALRRRQGARRHCFSVRPSQWPQSVGKAGTPCQATTLRLACASCWTGTRGTCGTRPLRPPAALLHNAAFCKVVASRYAKATLGVVHRLRALTGLQNRRYAKWPSLEAVAQPSALPGQFLPSAPPSGRPYGVLAPWHWSVASQVFQSVACGQSTPVSPRPPHRGLAAARHWPPCAGLPVCPPRGRPQSGAKTRRLTAATINCWSRQPATEYVVGIVLQFSRASSPRASPP